MTCTSTCGSPTLKPIDQEPVFREPWEAQAFAMAVKLQEKGHFTSSEWAEALGAEIAAHPHESYYECWLAALELLVERKGLMTAIERKGCIQDWDEAAQKTPHGKPIMISRL
ncbi:MAG: nitrile hydratase accessory protein [Rhizobiales bacterium]|nr:nitrile hydratase accessory protein [Hyphomicrobiales bacterium]